MTNETYPWSFVTYSVAANQVMAAIVKLLNDNFNLTIRNSWFSIYVASQLAATFYQGNPDMNHKLWNVGSTERYILYMQALMECWENLHQPCIGLIFRTTCVPYILYSANWIQGCTYVPSSFDIINWLHYIKSSVLYSQSSTLCLRRRTYCI